MITTLMNLYCKFCLTNYHICEDNPSIYIPICNCEQEYANIMYKLEDIEQ